ncbi:hypothetical protein [Natronomonas marina]|uniref:hypothetical protein n=1 Tax=Natronomonas marina TaxID=2961939 RepID=UPI0020C9C78C|nr:hypothetical protein [Natronomonas marina]
MPLRCLACDREFPSIGAYKRHEWRTHGGDLDRGDSATEPTPISSLVENPPDPPTL